VVVVVAVGPGAVVVVVIGAGAGASAAALVVVVVVGAVNAGPDVVGEVAEADGAVCPPEAGVVSGQSDDRRIVVTVTVSGRTAPVGAPGAGPPVDVATDPAVLGRDGAAAATVMPPRAPA
jgi:hypothetical protein